MAKGLKSVPTLSANEIAKKHGVSLEYIAKQIAKGVKIEKEHTKSTKEANEIARDHLGERPDYYIKLNKMEKSKVVKEESSVSGVRGLGYVSGNPAGINYVQQYIDTNAMSYDDINGNKLGWINKKHKDLHNKKTPFNTFDPTNIDDNKNFVNEGISAGPERSSNYSIGDVTGGRTLYRPLDVKEGAKLQKVKKATMAGITAANLYTAGDVMSKASEGRGSPKGDVVRMATTLPRAAGWAATGVHYAKKAYDRVKQMKEDKDPCWKGYEMVGMKKKGGRKVPNCVPVKESEMEEGYASIGNWSNFGDGFKAKKTYGFKPKGKPESNEPGTDDTYKGSKQSGKVKLTKTVKEARINEISAKLVGKVHNKKYLEKGKAPSDTVARAVKKKWIESKVGRMPEKKKIKEAAATYQPPSYQPTQTQIQRAAPASQQRLQGNTYRAGQSFSSQGTRVSPSNVRMSSSGYGTMKPTSTEVSRNVSSRYRAGFSQQGSGSMKPSSIGGGSSFSQGGVNVGKKMAASKQTSSVVKGMTSAGRAAVGGAEKAAASAVGRAAGAMSGPVGAAIGAAAPALGAAMKKSHEAGHKSFAQHSDSGEKASSVFARMKQPSQGRSVSQYEKDVLTPKASEAPRPKVDAPTPPSRPDYFSKGQAFGAARKEAGGGEGKFSYDNKSYQTNVKSEPYKPASQLKQTSIKEELMDTKDIIHEAIGNIMEENLHEMKENFLIALQEKAMEKLDERKKEIAANYFAQN